MVMNLAALIPRVGTARASSAYAPWVDLLCAAMDCRFRTVCLAVAVDPAAATDDGKPGSSMACVRGDSLAVA